MRSYQAGGPPPSEVAPPTFLSPSPRARSHWLPVWCVSHPMALGFRDDGGWSVRAQRLLARLLHPSRRHVSLNALLDAVNVCGLNGYDVLTLLQALFFHAMLVAAVPALWAHPSALLSLTALQLCGGRVGLPRLPALRQRQRRRQARRVPLLPPSPPVGVRHRFHAGAVAAAAQSELRVLPAPARGRRRRRWRRQPRGRWSAAPRVLCGAGQRPRP